MFTGILRRPVTAGERSRAAGAATPSRDPYLRLPHALRASERLRIEPPIVKGSLSILESHELLVWALNQGDHPERHSPIVAEFGAPPPFIDRFDDIDRTRK